MSNSTEADPRDIIDETLERVKRIEGMIEQELQLRVNIKKGANTRDVLEHIAENGPSTSSDLDGIVSNTTRALTTLYQGGYVNRNGQRPYRYRISEKGRRALAKERAKEQASENQTEIAEATTPSNPWDGTDLYPGQYRVLEAIDDYNGHPKSEHIKEYIEEEVEELQASSAHPTLFAVFDEGYVDRTPSRPYRYWLTEKGRRILD